MNKQKGLSEMTLEELWELFPIELVPYNPDWEIWAAEEIESLRAILWTLEEDGLAKPVINHIGSTAIAGIYAKPTIDILVEMPDPESWDKVAVLMEENGYILMSRGERRMSFNKGYTPEGYAERVFHIHFHEPGDNAEILFRDYLRQHPEIAKEYEKLKLSLLPEHRNNRDGYTEAKTDFVKKIVRMARLEKS